MVVVISIIAILTLITATALLSSRDQYYSDQASEVAVSAIREAQNKAISFMQSETDPTASVKIWGTSFKEVDNSIGLIYVNEVGENNQEESKQINSGVKIETTSLDNTVYVYYAAPFGTPYVMNNECTNWTISNKPTKEYEPSCEYLENNETTTISFEYKDHIYNVVINSKGVASVR